MTTKRKAPVETVAQETTTQETTTQKNYKVTPKGKEEFLAIVANKPFNTVVAILGLLEKETLTEEEANAFINFIGNYPYVEVVDFFKNLTDNITLLQ